MSYPAAGGRTCARIHCVLAAAGLGLLAGCVTAPAVDHPFRAMAKSSVVVDDEAASSRHPQEQASGNDDPAGPKRVSSTAPSTRATENWHIDLAFRGSYPRLGATEQLLDRRLEIPLRLDVLGVFHHPYTPIDRKTDLGLSSLYVGIGREVEDWLLWTLYSGIGAGNDKNHQRFLNANLDIDFKYAYAYAGITAEIYPWKVPRADHRLAFATSIRASRPFLLTGFETGYVSGEGRWVYKLPPMIIYRDQEKTRDWLTSYLIGLGWAFPINTNWSFNLVGDYKFHFYRPEEYNGWNFGAVLRYRF